MILNPKNMKLITQTAKKVVLEVKTSRIKARGFYSVWDEIRDRFPETEYNLFSIDSEDDEGSIFIELFKKQVRKKKNKTPASKQKVG